MRFTNWIRRALHVSEPETPAPEQVTVDPNAPAPTAPELDVTQPVPPAEAPPLPADPNTSGSPPAAVSFTYEPVEPPPPAPELDVAEPAPPWEAAPLDAEPAPPSPTNVEVPTNPNAGVLGELLAELRDLKAKIVAAIGA